MKRLLLVHGKDKSPHDIWYAWLGTKVRAADMGYIAPALTTGGVPVLRDWLAAITTVEPDNDTILLGHSRGGMAILRWLEQAHDNVRVARVILVATNRGDMPDQAGGDFFDKGEYDFAAIKRHCSDFVVLHSKDDQWVPFEAGAHIAEGLGARFITFEDRGHFGGDMCEFPELLDVILA